MSIGGASAGSIAATLLAAAGPKQQAKAGKLSDILSGMPMKEFVDGDSDARDFSLLLSEKDPKIMKLLWKGAQILDNLFEEQGLNPGKKFERWLSEELARLHVPTAEDLVALMNKNPEFVRTDTGENLSKSLSTELAVVAADITTQTKVAFPRMAGMYWAAPSSLNPAVFCRASMSIPLFFEPLRVKVPQDHGVKNLWDRLANWDSTRQFPKEVTFADGGVMSNFPIDLFHESGVPLAPTFGIRLGTDKRSIVETNTLGRYTVALTEAMRHNADYTFLTTHPDYNQLIGYVDTGEHHWLDFDMTAEHQLDLFIRGMTAAMLFLERFNWTAYKSVRQQIRLASRAEALSVLS